MRELAPSSGRGKSPLSPRHPVYPVRRDPGKPAGRGRRPAGLPPWCHALIAARSCTSVQRNCTTHNTETTSSVGRRPIRLTTSAPMGAPTATTGAAASQFSKVPGLNVANQHLFTQMPTIEVNAIRITDVGMAILRSACTSNTSTMYKHHVDADTGNAGDTQGAEEPHNETCLVVPGNIVRRHSLVAGDFIDADKVKDAEAAPHGGEQQLDEQVGGVRRNEQDTQGACPPVLQAMRL